MSKREFTEESFLEMMRGFMPVSVVFAGLEHGVFDKLAKSKMDAAQTARAIRCSARGTESLLNALAAIGLLEKKGKVFSLSAFAKERLVEGAPGYIGNMTYHNGHIMQTWSKLPECVKTGKPAPRPEPGSPDAKKRHRHFILAMDDNAKKYADLLVDKLDLRGVKSAIDVGGGPGTYAFALARKNPSMCVAVYDTPPTCAIAREQIMKRGFQSQVGTIEGDFIRDSLGTGFDFALMSNILHIYSPAQNRKLIKKGFNALTAGGRLAVVEFKLDKSCTSPASGALFGINMLVNTETGAAYPTDDIKSWMREAGFASVTAVDLDARAVAIVGKKPAAPARKKK